MAKNNFNEFISESNLENLPLDIIDVICGSPTALVKVSQTMTQLPFLVRETLFWKKVKKFVEGVYLEPGDSQKLSERLADNLRDSEYGSRLFKILDDLDTNAKVEYVINLTRALIQGQIDNLLYFRLCNALSKTLDEDLDFIKKNIGYSVFKKSVAIIELANNGLMFDGHEGFAFTELGFRLDEFALSYNDENRKEKFDSSKLPKEKQYIFTSDDDIENGDIDFSDIKF